MANPPIVYADDPDAHVDWPVTEDNGVTLDWADPMVAVGPGPYDITAAWLGDPATTRYLRVPLTGLTPGARAVYLKVPGGSDIKLGAVIVQERH